ncbi:putative type VI secretion system effector [Variovorax sp. VaC1]|uniref:putative type VI secretion system effector n=1 Tax=Variovorax sp. VaC1 TaxID=3373132 RepID=UPI0037481D51
MSAEKQPGLVKLTGVITNYKVTRSTASFIFTDSDRNAMGVVAIAAAAVGLSGPAIATASTAANTEEEADYVEFDLDGQVVRGWVWRSPFKEGEKVEAVVEWRGDHYETAGIARPSDRVIALYPHCSRGRTKHIRNAVKWWLIGTTLMVALLLLARIATLPIELAFRGLLEEGAFVILGFYLFFGLMAFRLALRWMPFVRLTEKVFRTLGKSSPSNVDLVKSTKAQRKPDDPGELGTFYFRY